MARNSEVRDRALPHIRILADYLNSKDIDPLHPVATIWLLRAARGVLPLLADAPPEVQANLQAYCFSCAVIAEIAQAQAHDGIDASDEDIAELQALITEVFNDQTNALENEAPPVVVIAVGSLSDYGGMPQ